MRVRTIRRLIFFFCLIAAVRVWTYSSAFPFFNNVDEVMHFDLIVKYYKSNLPDTLARLSDMTAHYMAGCGSGEFSEPASSALSRGYPAFLRDMNDPEVSGIFKGNKAFWEQVPNYEAGLAPLYYAISALWVKAAMVSGLVEPYSCALLYYVRFLNVLIIVCLVWVAYKVVSFASPQNEFLQVGVPMFVAILPQDTFYSIQNDNLSPLCYGIALLTAFRFLRSEIPSTRQAGFAGIAISLTLLVKTSNLPLLLVILLPVTFKMFQSIRNQTFRPKRKPFLLFYLFALLPSAVWSLRNLYVHGDLTASESKIRHLGWTHKPFSEWLDTHFLSLDGICNFWTELMASYWRGELVWASARLSDQRMDTFYWVSSLVFVIVALVFTANRTHEERLSHRVTVWSFLSLIVFLILLSLNFEFPESSYPSYGRPYFVSGRLMSASLIPFLILYLTGFRKLFGFIKNDRIKISILGLIALMITVGEALINKPVFLSHYNFFSMMSM